MVARTLGLAIREGMMLPPGTVLDLLQLEKNSQKSQEEVR